MIQGSDIYRLRWALPALVAILLCCVPVLAQPAPSQPAAPAQTTAKPGQEPDRTTAQAPTAPPPTPNGAGETAPRAVEEARESAPSTAQEPVVRRMSLLQAAVIGVVEGITEYLPVSSTGHIILTQRVLGIGTDSQQSKEAADAFAVTVQVGAIVAVLGLYYKRVRQGVMGLMGRDPAGLRLTINLIAGVAPALFFGALLSSKIKHYLFGLWPITFAWLVGGLAILWVSYRKPKQQGTQDQGLTVDDLTWRAALAIGMAQCIAMWPGTSRSLITIVAGVLMGMSLTAAVEFSFLLGVLTLTAATLKDLHEHGRLMLDLYGPMTMFVGFLSAFLSAVLAIEWLVNYLKKHGMEIFGYYRVALALIVGALLLMGVIHP